MWEAFTKINSVVIVVLQLHVSETKLIGFNYGV